MAFRSSTTWARAQSRPSRRNRLRASRWPRGPTWSASRATSCSGAHSPGSCSVAPTSSSGCVAIRSSARYGSTSSRLPRSRGRCFSITRSRTRFPSSGSSGRTRRWCARGPGGSRRQRPARRRRRSPAGRVAELRVRARGVTRVTATRRRAAARRRRPRRPTPTRLPHAHGRGGRRGRAPGRRRPRMSELWDFLRGALMTKALAAVVDAGVPEALAEGPQPVATLNGDPDTLQRLLRALASDGVFRETDPGVFEHTESSRLRVGPGWGEFAHLVGGGFFDATTELDASTAESPFQDRFGTGFWEWLAARPDERAAFDAAMAGERDRAAERLAALEWREDDVVVDVGGGNGTTLVELILRRPELRGIVLDLSETVRDEAALGDRIEFVPGNFFESVPAGDAYLLSGILHDWP